MYKLCKTEASTLRQREMTSSFIKLLQKRNYHELTIADICRELNVPRNTFYRYFSDKEAMLNALVDHFLLDMEDYVSSCEPGKSQIKRMLFYWVEHRELLDTLEKNDLNSIFITRSMIQCLGMRTLSPYFHLQDAKLQRYINIFSVGGVFSALVAWYHFGFTESIEEMTVLLSQLLTEPQFDME